MMNLKALCGNAGLTGPDAETAIRSYSRKTPLTATDLLDLSVLTGAEQLVVLNAWYGSDGGRVATLVAEAYR